MKQYFFLFLFLAATAFSQNQVSGTVTDQKGAAVAGANVFIEGTYDGATTNAAGEFNFTTALSGNQTLMVTDLIHETVNHSFVVGSGKIVVKLRESVNQLDAVVITAGTFEAGDKARVSVLKPLDIVTTAGSAGNIIAALQTLPGTQTVGEDGRLFVRGGEAGETQTFIDGIRVAQPYGATTDNLPTRGRFSPFLFNGISFSTGGYSAEYGDALSSILLLNTIDDPDQEKTDISLMTVGLGVGNTQKWQKNSLSINAAYIDLAPYQVAVPQDVDWNRPYQSLSGESVYRHHFGTGMLKVYAAFNAERFDLNKYSINPDRNARIDMMNNNFYFNSSFSGTLANNWQMLSGVSYGYNGNKTGINKDGLENSEQASHFKLKFRNKISERIKIAFGADYFITRFDEAYSAFEGDRFFTAYDSEIMAAYAETDIFFSKKFAVKVGTRFSYSGLLQETVVSPRVSVAYKIKKGQFSFAYGEFSQVPDQEYVKYSKFHRFNHQSASHYILNYQYSRAKQTFRAEAFYKKYDNLVKYDSGLPAYDSDFSNFGRGFAKGIDIFWRDGKSVKNLEYWISYSFIDTKRDYRNFTESATPSFVAAHSLSMVGKVWVNELRSQLGVTNSFSTGRPYNDPNQTDFMAGRTKGYNNLSVSWAYLLSAQKILYFSASNVLGTQNVFSYEYSDVPNGSGAFDRQPIRPTADRFFFVGLFWTISEDKKSNQLENL